MLTKMMMFVLIAALCGAMTGCGDDTPESGESSGIVDHLLGRPTTSDDGPPASEPEFCDLGSEVDKAHTALHAGEDLTPWDGPAGIAKRVRTMAETTEDEALATAAREVADGLDAVANGADMDETFEAEPLRLSAIKLFDTIDACAE